MATGWGSPSSWPTTPRTWLATRPAWARARRPTAGGHTYGLAVLHGLAHPDHGPRLRSVLARDLDATGVATAIGLVRASGGIERALDTARAHADQARTALDPLPVGPARTALARLADYAVTRVVPATPDLASAFAPDTV